MPKYVYYCEVCEETFDVVHGMTEKHNLCNLCGESDFVYRIPQKTSIQKPKESGHLVDEFIDKNKQTLEEMIRETKDKDYEF